jgi:hypothetical protein
MKARLFFCAALLAGSAHAEFWDGNRLLDRMNGGIAEQMQALGYVMGISDMGQGTLHCPPPNATAGQMEDIVKRYLNNNPAVRHLSADTIVNRALALVFPCSTGGKKL